MRTFHAVGRGGYKSRRVSWPLACDHTAQQGHPVSLLHCRTCRTPEGPKGRIATLDWTRDGASESQWRPHGTTMSNKVVPVVYRSIISDVIESVRQDFDEVGVEEAVLQELLRSWENKVAKSRVADFTTDPKLAAVARNFPPMPTPSASTSAALVAPKPKETKPVIPANPSTNASKSESDEDAINSDLDDPDDDLDAEEEEAGADGGDLVIALYEKVQRVKNKWKVTLKDGVVSVGGKEYLFAKCSGEFEW